MAEPSQKAADIEFLVTRVGAVTVGFGVLLYVLVYKLGKIEETMLARFDLMQNAMHVEINRTVRNTRAIQQKLGIPVILDSDSR